ncbi:MAG TPA: hypothetical protein ACFCUY_16735 [Xenococcaceae cyanobacterium]
MISTGRETENIIVNGLLFLSSAILLRLVWNSAIVIHGLGHTIAIAVSDWQLSVLTMANVLEQRSIKAVLKSLLPFNYIFIPLLTPDLPYLAAGNSTQIRVKALGGILFNLLGVGFLVFFAPNNLISQTLIGANALIALASLSDIDALVTGAADCFYCGNFGLIAQRQPDDSNELLPARMAEIAQIMGRETEIRGEQAGGGLVLARNGDRVVFVGKKIVNRKRANLTKSLEAAFAPLRKKAIASGIEPLKSLVMGVWHYRYATSGTAPSALETHWHEWIGARQEKVWQFNGREWLCQTQNVNHRITHNGDFDAWILFNQEINNVTLGLWLERVLHTPNAAKGDSPKIAGMMDLLITQGMWYASVRLAYQMAIAQHLALNKIATATELAFPSVADLTSWAKIFESTFASFPDFPPPDSPYFSPYQDRLAKNILQALGDRGFPQSIELSKVAFVKTAIKAFFNNDLYRATQIFIAQAKGSFGLVTVSTLEDSQLVLSAKGQPITIGFNWQQKYLVYASEPAAVDRVLANVSGASRLDLNQQTGEIAKVSAENLTIYSLKAKRELKPSELENRWISLQHHPYSTYIQFSETKDRDPVENDITSIPRILAEIKTSWQDSASLNRQSADYLVHLLSEKLQRFEQKRQKMFQAGLMSQIRRMPTVDLLITGEENSLWLGKRFAQNLNLVFPLLNIVTISANEVLQQLNQNFSELYLGKDSLILAITQSGQTFSTVQVINTFDHLCNQGVIGELFILTGELSSFINSTQGNGGLTVVGASPFLNNPHRHRIFVNGSGRRTAEPSTVTVAAAGQTLTELLFYLAKQMRHNFPQIKPFGMTLTTESLMVLTMMKEDFLNKNVRQIIGVTATGEPIKSTIRQKLIRSGRHWGLHVTETPLAWAIHALYVLISVGWVIPFGETMPLVKTLLQLIFNLANLSPSLFKAIAPAITLADIAIYIFGSWLWTLLIRYVQGRQLLARIGKRTLVIGDVSWVNQLLQAYVSKLFSLSYGIATLEVHGSNPQNHFLHAFGHRVVRGTLIFLGVPDGRRSQKLQEAEQAVLMTGKQANGVRNINIGAEILVMSHNTAIADQGFENTLFLDSNDDAIYFRNPIVAEQKEQIEELRESCFGAFERLLASYVFFWALAKKVASFPLLGYEYWKSQSRTKIITTASPVSGLDSSKFTNKPRSNRKTKSLK